MIGPKLKAATAPARPRSPGECFRRSRVGRPLAPGTEEATRRLAEACALLGESYGVAPPRADRPTEVLVFLAEVLAALVIEFKPSAPQHRRGRR